MRVADCASSTSKKAAVEASTRAPGLTGKTHANSAGLPEYWIRSQSTDCVAETLITMRWPDTTVGGSEVRKQPPHAAASWSGKRPLATTTEPVTTSPKRARERRGELGKGHEFLGRPVGQSVPAMIRASAAERAVGDESC